MKSATLDEVIHSLKEEKENEVGCRFPCRVILLHSRESYISCVNALKQICDKTISADELFSGADVMPGYDTLLSKVDSDKWMLLPGVSEYLRLFSASERRSGRFAKLWRKAIDASTKGRILIPLWNCDTLWFDKALEFALDERQDDYVWSISDDEPSIPEKLYIKILSSDFEAYINQLNEKYSMIIGLRDWYSGMVENSKLPNDYCLLTKQARSVENSVGNITINVTKDAFSFVSANLNGGQSLKRDELSDAALNELFDEALKNTSVNQAILNRFNMSQFDANLMISGWDNMPDGKRELVRLWYRLNPDNSYLCHCFEVSELCDVEKHIMLDIFDLLNSHQEWIKEYCELSNRLKLKKDDVFFKKLDGIPLYSDRLLFLSSNTREERIYLIRMVGQWMRQNAEEVRDSLKLKAIYPALSWYLTGLPSDLDSSWDKYMSDYKKYKLTNTLPVSDDDLLSSVSTDTLPYRYALLKQNIKSDTVILWIDAMGFEYLSILCKVLEEDKNGRIAGASLAQAALPSETAFNEQWKQMNVPSEKLDKLDKLAHKGVIDEPDYYSCIEEQISFFDKVRVMVDKLLERYRYVVITGDHGTSRLAARFFHLRQGLTPPKDAVVMSHGRYCLLKSDAAVAYDSVKDVSDAAGNRYWVISSYDHFSIGGFAAGGDDDNAIYGEVHGGASPEEMVVPVVVFEKIGALPLTVKWKNDKNQIKLKRGTAKAELELSRAVSSLQVKIGKYDAVCSSTDGLNWTVTIDGIKADTYNPAIVADGKLLSIDKQLVIKSALGGGEGDL